MKKKKLYCKLCKKSFLVPTVDRNVKPCPTPDCEGSARRVAPADATKDIKEVSVSLSENKSSYKVKCADKGIFLPLVDENFYVSPANTTFFDIVDDMSKAEPQNVMLVGPHGCGKTELAVWFAAMKKRKCIVMNSPLIREAKDWFGYRDAKDGSIFWHKSDFVRALEEGDTVVVLDEFNRLHSTLHNSLFPLLDARRASWVEDLGEMVRVGPGTVFFGTANIGYAHSGTFAIDAAMSGRFTNWLEVSFLQPQDEIKVLMQKTGISKEIAKRLTQFARDVRRKSNGVGSTLSQAVSTRQLLASAKMMRHLEKRKMDVKQALDYTVVALYPNDGGRDSEQSQILQLIQGIFG